MTMSVDVDKFALGAGEMEIAATAGTDGWGEGWESLGPTMDNNVFRVTQTKFTPTLAQQKGPVKGLSRIVEEVGELEVTIPELSAARMALIVPASVATISPITETGTGFASDLDGAVAIGASIITVTSGTGITAGDYLRIEEVAAGPTDPPEEYRQVVAVDTNDVTLDRPLSFAHLDTATVTQTDGDGRTTITGAANRVIPLAAYRCYRLRTETLAGIYDFYIRDAINITDAKELAFGRESQAAPRLTLRAHRDPTAMDVVPWKMVTPGVDA